MICEFIFLKSRTNCSGIPCEMIFEQKTGFQKALSLLHFAVQNKIVQGSNRAMFFPSLPNVTFTRKTFSDVVQNHPELLEAMYDDCLPLLSNLLSTGRDNMDETEEDRLSAVCDVFKSIMEDLEEAA